MRHPLFLFIFLFLITAWAFTQSFLNEDKEFTILISGADDGVLIPCGCTGGQLGGIARRATLIAGSFAENEPRLILSTGGVCGGADPLHRIRFEVLLISQEEMGYDALGVGPEELNLGYETLSEARDMVSHDFVLTNGKYKDKKDSPLVPFTLKEVNRQKVLILAIIPERFKDKLPQEVEFMDPRVAIQNAIDANPGIDLTLVLLRGDRKEAKDIDAFLPNPRLIYYSSSHSEYEVYEFGKQEGLIRYISPGGRGRYMVSCDIRLNAENVLESKDPVIHPLRLDLPESDLINEFAYSWYEQMLQDEDVLAQMVEQKPMPKGGPYVGDETCILCHKKACHTWDKSAHAHAFETLVKDNREYDPECISCHTVGFGYKTGFKSPESTPWLLDVGCESCHGPCKAHVVSAGRIKTPQKVDCTTCHDIDHSSGFDREEYWKKIRCESDGPQEN